MKPKTEHLLNAATVIATLCAMAVAGLRVRDAFADRGNAREKPTEVAAWQAYSDAGVRIGPTTARVTIVEFSDFQCPFCRKAATYLDALRQRYPDDVAIVYRHFPIHQFAREAAIATECARRQASFKALYDRLFATPDSIGKEAWTSFAVAAGVADTSSFGACMHDAVAAHVITVDSTAALKLGVTGTPTFLVNELRVAGFEGDSVMDKYVANALKRSRR
jgi:protein-disulfide isomerase